MSATKGKTEDFPLSLFIAVWVICVLVGLAFWGVVIWGIISVVNALT